MGDWFRRFMGRAKPTRLTPVKLKDGELAYVSADELQRRAIKALSRAHEAKSFQSSAAFANGYATLCAELRRRGIHPPQWKRKAGGES